MSTLARAIPYDADPAKAVVLDSEDANVSVSGWARAW